MPELVLNRFKGSVQPNLIVLYGTIEMGAAVIANQTGNRNSGVTWIRNAAGDFRATLHKAYRRCMALGGNISQPALGTVPTLASGTLVLPCGASSAMMLGTAGVTTAALGLVTVRTDTEVLADPTNGCFINWWMVLSESAL
jgi:hypothetical protein